METDAVARKRLKVRAWRRGMRETDLILGPYADARLAGMDRAGLAQFGALLDENDQDMLLWILGGQARPAGFAALLDDIAAFAGARSAGQR
ncbi:MAG: FAD assembly factor SdhE [Gemmobacter sp.]